MNKFQKLNFRSVDDFLEFLPDQERPMVNFLRDLVLESIPDCKEKLAYNVPYYYRHSRICFVWPASIPWGNVQQNGVLFGFCNGHLLNDNLHYLDKGSRKQVFTKTFKGIYEIETHLLKSYIFEAVEIDNELYKQKKIENN